MMTRLAYELLICRFLLAHSCDHETTFWPFELFRIREHSKNCIEFFFLLEFHFLRNTIIVAWLFPRPWLFHTEIENHFIEHKLLPTFTLTQLNNSQRKLSGISR